jgi:flagellin
MAKEMVNYTKTQILQQAGTSILAQANQSSQGVLALLR